MSNVPQQLVYQAMPLSNGGSPKAVYQKGKAGLKVCIKRADGSMVEQPHLSVSQNKDGQLMLTSNSPQGPNNNGMMNGTSQPIRAVLVPDGKGGGTPRAIANQSPAPTSQQQRLTPSKTPKHVVTAPIRNPVLPMPQQRYSSPGLQQQLVVTNGGIPTQQGNNQWGKNSVLNQLMVPNGGPPTAVLPKKRQSPAEDKYYVRPTPTALPAAGGTSDRKRQRRSSERGGRGLRHFSSKVCEKVKSKGTTTYQEVSDELVSEFNASHHPLQTPCSANFDVKNIRRRVYDALNVLCAMDIISKDKKEIRWKGLPTNSHQECAQLEIQKGEVQQRIKDKKKRAQELMLQLIAYRTLIQRNKDLEARTGPLPENAAIQVPFIILSTGPSTQIGLEVADDKTEYEFTFNELFEVHNEISILKKMGFCYNLDSGVYTEDDMTRAENLLPKCAKPFLKEFFPHKTPAELAAEEKERVDVVTNPQQISIKHEPQELTEVQMQAIETYNFDAATNYSSYRSNSKPGGGKRNFSVDPTKNDGIRDKQAATALLSLNQ